MNELTRQLEERRDSARRILGDEHPLTQLISSALESGDPQFLKVAKAACDGGHGMLHPWTNLREPTRDELLEEYADKPVRCFLQVDGREDKDGEDSVVHSDEEGYVLTGGTRYELRNTDFPLRLQIHEGSDKETVLTLLNKAHRWLERGWDRLITPSSSQTPDKQPTEEERTTRFEERRTSEERGVHSEEQHTEEESVVHGKVKSATLPEEREPTGAESEPSQELARSFSSSSLGGDSRQQAHAFLERAFVLNVDMVKLDPEAVAHIASERPKYIEAYLEVADQGIEWFTKFRNALATMR